MKLNKSEKEKTSLDIYFNEINNGEKYPLINRIKEKEYSIKMANGDENARKKLIESNLRYVISIAKKYQGCGFPLEDLISEGNAGLIKAADKFDHTKEVRFITYAKSWIKHEILIAIYNQSRIIRIPVNKFQQISKIKKKFDNSEGTSYEKIQKIAKEFDIKEKLIAESLNLSMGVVSIDALVLGLDKPAAFEEILGDKKYKSPEESAIFSNLTKDINNSLNNLCSPRDKEIIEYRLGLNGKSHLSLKKIAKKYGLTYSRIEQIEKKFLKELKNPLYGLISYLRA